MFARALSHGRFRVAGTARMPRAVTLTVGRRHSVRRVSVAAASAAAAPRAAALPHRGVGSWAHPSHVARTAAAGTAAQPVTAPPAATAGERTDFAGPVWLDTCVLPRVLLASPAAAATARYGDLNVRDVYPRLSAFRKALQKQLFVGFQTETPKAVAPDAPAHHKAAYGVLPPTTPAHVAAQAQRVYDAVLLLEAFALLVHRDLFVRTDGYFGAGHNPAQAAALEHGALELLPLVAGVLLRPSSSIAAADANSTTAEERAGDGLRRLHAARWLPDAFEMLRWLDPPTYDGDVRPPPHAADRSPLPLQLALEQCVLEAALDGTRWSVAAAAGGAPNRAAVDSSTHAVDRYVQHLYLQAAPQAAVEQHIAEGGRALLAAAAAHHAHADAVTDAKTGARTTASGSAGGSGEPPHWHGVRANAFAAAERLHVPLLAQALDACRAAAKTAAAASASHAAPTTATFVSPAGVTVTFPDARALADAATQGTGADLLLAELNARAAAASDVAHAHKHQWKHDVRAGVAAASTGQPQPRPEPAPEQLEAERVLALCARASLYVCGDALVTDVPPCPVDGGDELQALWQKALPAARATFAATRAAIRARASASGDAKDDQQRARAIDTYDRMSAANHHSTLCQLELLRAKAVYGLYQRVVSGRALSPQQQQQPAPWPEKVMDSARRAYAHGERLVSTELDVWLSRHVALQRAAASAFWWSQTITAFMLPSTPAAAAYRARIVATGTDEEKQQLQAVMGVRGNLQARSNLAYGEALKLVAQPTVPALRAAAPDAPDWRALWLAREQLMEANDACPPDPLRGDDEAAVTATWLRVHKRYGVTVPDTLPLLSRTGVFDDTTRRAIMAPRARDVLHVFTHIMLNPLDPLGAQVVGSAAKWEPGAGEGLRITLYHAWAEMRDTVSYPPLSETADATDCIDAAVAAAVALHDALKARAPAPAGEPLALVAAEHVRADLLLCQAAGLLYAADAFNAAAPTVLPAPGPVAGPKELKADHKRRAVALIEAVERDLLRAVALTAQPMYRARIAALRAVASA